MHPRLAVIDASIAPRRTSFNFGAPRGLKLTGCYLEGKYFTPFQIDTATPSQDAACGSP